MIKVPHARYAVRNVNDLYGKLSAYSIIFSTFLTSRLLVFFHLLNFRLVRLRYSERFIFGQHPRFCLPHLCLEYLGSDKRTHGPEKFFFLGFFGEIRYFAARARTSAYPILLIKRILPLNLIKLSVRKILGF